MDISGKQIGLQKALRDLYDSQQFPKMYSMANKWTNQYQPGSSCPPLAEGKLRLYSMRFCPFCQRARLVLIAKGIPHDIVNVDLKSKPDWLFHIHPEGKVPAVDTGNEVVIESLDVANFLDEKYPGASLYPADDKLKAKDKQLIEKYGKVVGAVTAAIYNKENKPVSAYMADIFEPLEEFELELSQRGTPFFGGENVGMVDLMMWPWVERAKIPSAMKNEEFTFPTDKFSKLVEWKNAMREVEAVKNTFIDTDTHVKFLRGYFGGTPEFDNL